MSSIIDAIHSVVYISPFEPARKCSARLDKAIYVISDEHYRGNMDNEHLTSLFATIYDDIKKNKVGVDLVFLGDNIEGILHKSSLKAAPETITQQMLQYIQCAIPHIDRLCSTGRINQISFVTESNHGQFRPLGSLRNEFPTDDVGYIIAEFLKPITSRHKVMLQYGPLLTVREDYVAFHGHQPWAKNINTIKQYLHDTHGKYPLVLMGHYHQFKVEQHGETTFVTAPAVKKAIYDYERIAGYPVAPGFLKIKDGSYTLMEIQYDR